MPENREDLRKEVRCEFKVNIHNNDRLSVQRALSEGKRRLEELQRLVGNDNREENSWMNTADPEDPRGRLGKGWPWER